ncbi:HD domain-containing protein [Deinococcus lacus]|uniref:HD domain-containing protein n=1 Tax=Deinococcus lacus TaxID=392561 RepID=A0ABW1YCG1_9DEIO
MPALPGKLVRLGRSLWAQQARPDDDWALGFLSAPEAAIYLAMDPRDREHGCRVAAAVGSACPQASAELLAAALLHDCGKSRRPYRVWERVLAGLLPWRWAGVLPWEPARLRAQHPRLGAEQLRAAGARPRVAELVACHHAPPPATWERSCCISSTISNKAGAASW